jgi:hypothetical protein
MIVEKQMECRLAGETEVPSRKPAPAPLLSITKSHMTRPGKVAQLTAGLRKCYNEELHYFYFHTSLGLLIEGDKMGRECRARR